MLNFNPYQNIVGNTPFPTYQPQIGAQPGYGFAPVSPGGGPFQAIQMLQQLLQSLSQLAAGWSGALGYPGQFPGYPQFPQPQPQPNYGGNPTQPGFPGVPGQIPAYPTDLGDFASYLQAQRIGGSLEGKTGIAQRDAIPGTRFGQVQDPTAWNASVARNYAYQFAAYAIGADPLSPQGLAQGAAAFPNMRPDAQIFTQVASVFKGNLLGGPGNYNNPGLKQLLLSRGLGDLANQPGVGQTDVQTIGAITQALNRGALSLNDIIQSGTIDNLDRYFQIINYVQGGSFNRDLQFYDHVRQ